MGTKITVNENGPYVVRSDDIEHIELVDKNGKAFEVRRVMALCRCGHSEDKPFCDGSHARHGFFDKSTA